MACIEIDRTVGTLAANLPDYDRDLADRLITTTAVERDGSLVSADD